RGVVKLSDEDLVAYTRAVGDLFALIPVSECASIAQSSEPPEASRALGAALAAADSSTQDAVVRGAMLAIRTEVSGEPGRTGSRDALYAAGRDLAGRLRSDEAARLSGIVTRGLGSSSGTDACWALSTVYRRVTRLIPVNEAA